jgi:hypothetical protein
VRDGAAAGVSVADTGNAARVLCGYEPMGEGVWDTASISYFPVLPRKRNCTHIEKST